MSKILNIYENGLDKTWYQSSNILYSECDDKENDLKVVRITFKDGRTYEYKDVNVHEYLKFREAQSQGSVFSQTLKKNPVVKLENKSVDEIQAELQSLLDPTDVKKITMTLEDITMVCGSEKLIVPNYSEMDVVEIVNKISSFFNITFENETDNDQNDRG